jgi:hypothetical protein
LCGEKASSRRQVWHEDQEDHAPCDADRSKDQEYIPKRSRLDLYGLFAIIGRTSTAVIRPLCVPAKVNSSLGDVRNRPYDRIA